MKEFPSFLNTEFYITHGEILANSYKNLTGNNLIKKSKKGLPKIIQLWNAPYAILSHGIEDDPIFNFGNRIALELFEFTFSDFIKLPSRKSAEEANREKRAKIMDEVAKNGFIRNYTGTRISATGKSFKILDTHIWNLSDREENLYGQAALFEKWEQKDI